jgi:hypothetical protein
MIHATTTAIAPAVAAFEQEFPEAELWHLLEDRLLVDADTAGGLTPDLRNRMLSLIGYAAQWGADGILLTCSMYGPVTGIARQLNHLPIYGSDEVMHTEVIASAPKRLALLASLTSAVDDAAERLASGMSAAGHGSSATLLRVVPEHAFTAAKENDTAGLTKALLSEAEPLDGTVDAFLLCQYSITGAYSEMQATLRSPVMSPPHLAAARLRSELTTGSSPS